ncbi:putative toxin-antitoxin system toxin component, PIN family [Halochromatium salexigens]|uniref:Toxin-antitoxin system toxin component, PIN family n=1 Tax=Halochromatium salexigens TaxID=49447 RepID=A0AAJ0UGU2_HALSE|nr:putative toxin-antitoxin system toxin component, PIN family [Halochromatium salexigens]MBK5931203.1 putative toxin-antitoxin system toxin component, PIN family [Halochromatium salexigens]
MRVVIDTNLLVSAVIRDRLPERVLLWCLGHSDIEWLVTPEIMAEYSAVIQRPKFSLPRATIDWWLELLAADTQMIEARGNIDFPRDRKDAPFLMCAAAGEADYLITGDGDFSEAQALIATPILSVRAFAQAVAPQTLVAPEG